MLLTKTPPPLLTIALIRSVRGQDRCALKQRAETESSPASNKELINKDNGPLDNGYMSGGNFLGLDKGT